MFIDIAGDFNYTLLSLMIYQLFINLSADQPDTRKQLDLLYANVNDTYHSIALPPLGNSDNNLHKHLNL